MVGYVYSPHSICHKVTVSAPRELALCWLHTIPHNNIPPLSRYLNHGMVSLAWPVCTLVSKTPEALNPMVEPQPEISHRYPLSITLCWWSHATPGLPAYITHCRDPMVVCHPATAARLFGLHWFNSVLLGSSYRQIRTILLGTHLCKSLVLTMQWLESLLTTPFTYIGPPWFSGVGYQQWKVQINIIYWSVAR